MALYEWYNPLWLSDRKRFVDEHMIPQFKDVVSRYKPAIIFADGEWDLPSKDWKSEQLLAWLFNDSPVKEEVVVNDRWGSECRHKHGGYYTTEYAALKSQTRFTPSLPVGLGKSWSWAVLKCRKTVL